MLTDSGHQRAGANLRYFERLLSKQLTEVKQSELTSFEEPIQIGTYARPKDHLPEREVYEALCRGEGVKMVKKILMINTYRHMISPLASQIYPNSEVFKPWNLCWLCISWSLRYFV